MVNGLPEDPYGRVLSGIRGLRLAVTEVRATFAYGGHQPEAVRQRTADGLARRGGPRDVAALALQRRVTGPGRDRG